MFTTLSAIFSVEIRTRQRAHLQAVATLVDNATALRCGADLEASARLVVERTAAGNPLRCASQLPEFRGGDFEFDTNDATVMGQVLVPRKVYERIQAADQPVFEHVIGAGVGRFVAVDPQTQEVVAILDSWL